MGFEKYISISESKRQQRLAEKKEKTDNINHIEIETSYNVCISFVVITEFLSNIFILLTRIMTTSRKQKNIEIMLLPVLQKLLQVVESDLDSILTTKY